jgi:hypothetical protein
MTETPLQKTIASPDLLQLDAKTYEENPESGG